MNARVRVFPDAGIFMCADLLFHIERIHAGGIVPPLLHELRPACLLFHFDAFARWVVRYSQMMPMKREGRAGVGTARAVG